MKYCYQCGRMTAGEPLFCHFCGRTYDVKLCPRRHANPRVAEVCSQCGSRELLDAAAEGSLLWKVMEFFVRVIVGLLIVYVVLEFRLRNGLRRPGQVTHLWRLGCSSAHSLFFGDVA